MCTCNQLSNLSQHAVTHRKAYKYKICISLPHTHAHGSMYVAACLQLCLPPPPSPPLLRGREGEGGREREGGRGREGEGGREREGGRGD